MSSLAEIYIKKSTLETMIKVLEQKNKDGISLCISTNTDTNQHGQNVWVRVSQTKEEKEAKKDIYTVGNGKVFWTDGVVKVAKKLESQISQNDVSNLNADDLPF